MPFKPTDYLPYDFANRRHIGPSPAEMSDMLKMVGAPNLNALIDETLPESIRQKEPLDFGKPMSERELLYHMRVTASKNKVMNSLIGQGYYGTVTPPVIQRNILENPAWYTAYTAESLDESEAIKAKEAAEQELANKDASLDYAKASAQLAEAVARLKTIQKLRKNQ